MNYRKKEIRPNLRQAMDRLAVTSLDELPVE
jgi:hypothetical protein